MAKKMIREVKTPYVVDPGDESIGRDTIIIQHDGEPVAVIVPYAEYKSWRTEEKPLVGEMDPEFRKQWQAFQRLKPELLKKHKGQWVAIVDEQVVAVGSTSQAVLTDALERYGDVPMCIEEVLEQPRVYCISGPRVIRMADGEFSR